MSKVFVNEGENVHIDVCVLLSGNIAEIEVPFFVEFDLCALEQGKEHSLSSKLISLALGNI